MKKGDLVKRERLTEFYKVDQLDIGDSGVIVRGPYEKNITDIFYEKNPSIWLLKPRVIEIKKVIDILHESKIYRFRLVSDYERVRK